MPPTVNLTEETISRVAPDNQVLSAGRGLGRDRNSFLKPGVSADGTWLLGEVKGSGKEPYEVSVDLAVASAPVGRCTCPSRKFPCKHAVGLMFFYLFNPSSFKRREPPDDLLARREKQVVRAQKKAEAADKPETAPKPRKVNQAALAKKITAQRQGLDLLEKLLIDLVAGGQWFEKSRLTRLERQSRQMSDSYLPGALIMLRRLMLLGDEDDISEEERLSRAGDLVAQLWATVQKGRNYLDGKLAGDESQGEADAVIEEVLGKAWQLTELKDRGYTRQNLRLFELAHERWDDEARQEQVQMSHFVDLGDGAIHRAVTYMPLRLGRSSGNRPEQAGYAQPLSVSEAAVYPGFINRRVRWDLAAEKLLPPTPSPLSKVYGLATPAFEGPLAAFRQQLKNHLAPREAVFLLRCKSIGRAGDSVVIEDAKGTRLEAADRRSDYSNVANLVRAAGELRKEPALLARFFVRPVANSIVAQPLALVTGQKHLRLGL
jgi:hypothetical protein